AGLAGARARDARRVLAGCAATAQARGRTRSPEEGSEGLVTEPVTASVRIAAPPDVVFPYFTDPALAVKWIANAAYLDARPGGTFAIDVRGNPARGEYVMVDPPHRVVFTWGIEGRE